MGYYLHLAKQYMWHNKARTMYSVLGIALTYILSFSILTVGYSIWDYIFYSVYASDPYELYSWDDAFSDDMIDKVIKLEKDPDVEALCIYTYSSDGRRLVLSSQLKKGENYELKVKLKTMKNLRAQAGSLNEKYGLSLEVYKYIEKYLREDESVQTALLNFLLTVAATAFGLFSVVILRNTMMIAVTERSRDFGLFRCVGMSDSQNTFLLLTEGILMSLIASLLGMGLGFELLKLSEPWLISMLKLESFFAFHFYPKAAIYTTVICMGVTLFSLIEPARLSAQVSPLEALHGVLAKELTVGKAIKLLAGKITGKKTKKKEKPSIVERLFGVPGFYAKRNTLRGRGSGKAVFIAVFITVALMLTVLSFLDSYKASIKKSMGDKASEYCEVIELSGGVDCPVYDDEKMESLSNALLKGDSVTDVFPVISNDHYSSISSMAGSPYFYSDKMKELSHGGKGNVAWILELGCNKENMEKERPYLMEGDIDYEKMIEENGVLLCDITTSDESGRRRTDLHAGDTIDILSVDGALKARDIFNDAIARASEQLGMPAWDEMDQGKKSLVYFENGEKQVRIPDENEKGIKTLMGFHRSYAEKNEDYDKLEDAVFEALKEAGYECRHLRPENNYEISGLLECVRQLLFDEGEVDTIKISGIISQEVFSGKAYENGGINSMQRSNYMRIIYPVESINRRIEYLAEKTGAIRKKNGYDFTALFLSDYRFCYRCEVGVKRDMDILDDKLMLFAQVNGLRYTCRYGRGYYEDVQQLNVITVAGGTVCTFILIVCLIQVINTLQADMRIRKRELWLYDVVGMEPAQKLKMMLIEHGFGVVVSALLGVVISLLLSYIVFQKWIIDAAGAEGYVFAWQVGAAILIVFGMFGIIAAVNLLEWKRSMQDGKR